MIFSHRFRSIFIDHLGNFRKNFSIMTLEFLHVIIIYLISCRVFLFSSFNSIQFNWLVCFIHSWNCWMNFINVECVCMHWIGHNIWWTTMLSLDNIVTFDACDLPIGYYLRWWRASSFRWWHQSNHLRKTLKQWKVNDDDDDDVDVELDLCVVTLLEIIRAKSFHLP